MKIWEKIEKSGKYLSVSPIVVEAMIGTLGPEDDENIYCPFNMSTKIALEFIGPLIIL